VIQEGTTIGAYTVQDRIGQGASAVVHRGWHKDLQRTVAMKFLPTIHEATARARFARESRALRRLDHPNIVQVLDTGEHEGTPYIVFDFVPGGSLGDRIAQEPLTDGEALAVLDGIAKGLDYAHRLNIVHRDVKPANVLMDLAGSPVIVDFGLARLLEQPSATATGLFAGTPAYMSPEQAEGKAIGPATDQYSLAALAYELLTGQVPFPGDTVSEVLVALLTRAPEVPSVLRPGLSPAVDAALLRGLDKDSALRWPSCQALTDAILTAMYTSSPAPRVAVMAAKAARAETMVVTRAKKPLERSRTIDPRIAALKFEPSEPHLTITMPRKDLVPAKRRRGLLALVAAAAFVAVSLVAGVAYSSNAFGTQVGNHPAAATVSP
jgi:serine/threonine-protein kinase